MNRGYQIYYRYIVGDSLYLILGKRLKINQSAVRRDLKYIKTESTKQLELDLREDASFQFQVHLYGLNQLIKKLWEIIDAGNNPNVTIRDRNYAISLLIQCYSKSSS